LAYLLFSASLMLSAISCPLPLKTLSYCLLISPPGQCLIHFLN
jgi:hypothetical protein